MKKEQQVILSLLKEIDQICRKHKIDYYLSPRLTQCAVMEQPFPQNPLFGVVLMKVADMERFRLAVEENPGEGRVLESMKNHKWFPGFYLRYENTDTLCMNLDSGLDYAYPGLGVNIFPLRTRISAGRTRKQNNREENGWLQICDSFNGDGNFQDFLVKTMMRIRCIGGQERLAGNLYDSFCKRMQEPEPKEYVLKRKKNITKFPAEIFEKTKEVTLEGEHFLVPFDTDLYLKTNYGDDYLKESEPPYIQSPALIVSARVSCEAFRQEFEGLDELVKERIRNGRKLAKERKLKDYLNECWDYAVFCGNRMNLGITYKRKKDYIKNLHKNGDYLTLEKVFKSYSKMMQKCLLREELFTGDEEIFDIYMDVLEKTGKAVQKNKILDLT